MATDVKNGTSVLSSTLDFDVLDDLRALTEGAPERQVDIPLVLSRIVGLGFVSSRYYDVALSPGTRQAALILTAVAGNTVGALGYRIPVQESAIGKVANSYRPALWKAGATPHGSVAESNLWISDLKLEGRSGIDLPMWFKGHLLGLISVDWYDGERSAATTQDLLLLDLIASRIANCIMHQPPREPLQRFHAALSASDVSRERFHGLLASACAEICEVLATPNAAIFEYSWQSNSITKIAESVHANFEGKRHEFPETYGALNPSLTWRAWENPSLRSISDFSAMRRATPELVDQSCVARHETMLGPLATLLYAVTSAQNSRFLIRIMNRVDHPQLPFVRRHAELLDAIASHIAQVIDQATTGDRVKSLQRAAQGLCERLGRPRDALLVMHRAFEEEGIANLAVFCHTDDGSPQFTYVDRAGPVLADWKAEDHMRIPCKDDRFYDKYVHNSGVHVLQVRRMADQTQSGHLLNFLLDKGINWLATCNFEGASLRGVVVCPLLSVSGSSEIQVSSSAPLMGYPREQIFATYTAMLGSALEAIESNLTVEGARKLVGHIGHEVNTPAVILGQRAKEMLMLARAHVLQAKPLPLQKLQDAYQSVEEQMRTIERTVDVATLVARETRGRLELDLRRHNVRELLQKVKESLKPEMILKMAGGVERRARVDVSESCDRMGDIICDGDLIHTVLLNLVRNGLKYSLPRHKDQPIVVAVHGLFQTNLVIFQVTNWGFGIPQEEREMIFRPFVRGSVIDSRKVTRGMGLGLYISRNIARAHGGTLRCVRSEFTLDDPARREKFEGFETTFELRLPRDLREGPHVHVWE